MNIRIKNIIETLKRLPAPTHTNQVLRTPVLSESWEPIADCVPVLTLKAVGYGIKDQRWLEWTMDI